MLGGLRDVLKKQIQSRYDGLNELCGGNELQRWQIFVLKRHDMPCRCEHGQL